MKRNIDTLGLDFGNTIAFKKDGVTIPLPNALRVIARLISERFHTNAHIVSRVSPGGDVKVLRLLTEYNFFEITGLPQRNLHFCFERHEKGPICKRLRITHHIDDRPEVMAHLTTVPGRILMNAVAEDIKRFKEQLQGVVKVRDWIEVEKHLL
jgi:hypothetical protein